MASFAVPEFSRTRVDKAGATWANPDAPWAAHMGALEVINNWRASHSCPLNNFQTNLRSKVKNIQSEILVAQRIKRLESITAKLVRDQTSTMLLSQMQDIGGCRAVMRNPANVAKLIEAYRHARFDHKLRSEKDYINSPKEDGYRSYHLIYQYQSLSFQNAAYNNLRIEIQIRTLLQHVWATAVESVGAFTQQALKSAQGSQDWRLLFALMSSVIARIEKGPRVPNTPINDVELRSELRQLASQLDAVKTLQTYRATLNYFGALKERIGEILFDEL
jgi:hypothetical protein